MQTEITVIELEEENQFLWRYLSYEKFEDLINSSELFLCRLDKFYDKNEGTLTDYSYKAIKNLFREFDNYNEMQSQLIFLLECLKKITFTNCWHVNSDENYEMWKSYTNLKNGILIKTDLKSLIRSFNFHTYGPMHLRPVKYGLLSEDIDLTFPLEIINFKEDSYKFENEYRINLLYTSGEVDEFDSNKININPPEKGIRIPITLNTLIKDIYTSPKSDETFLQMINQLIRNKLNINVKKSKFK